MSSIYILGPGPWISWAGKPGPGFHSQDWGLQIWLWRHGWMCLLPGTWVDWTAPWPWLEGLEPNVELVKVSWGVGVSIFHWVPVLAGLPVDLAVREQEPVTWHFQDPWDIGGSISWQVPMPGGLLADCGRDWLEPSTGTFQKYVHTFTKRQTKEW